MGMFRDPDQRILSGYHDDKDPPVTKICQQFQTRIAWDLEHTRIWTYPYGEIIREV